MKQVNSYLLQNCNGNFILKYINAVQLNMNKFKMDRLSIVPQYKKMSVHYHKQMNYKNIYTQLIERSRTEKRVKHQGIYYEEHHIVPKCLGGTNDPENLVLFTAREHFIAHWLLTKIYPNEPSIIFAFNSFSMKLHGATNHIGQIDSYSTSRNYERARIKIVELMKTDINPFREYNKSLFDTTYVNNGIISKRIKKTELQKYMDSGWVRGRIKFKRIKPTAETRQKMSKSKKGRPANQGSIDFFKNNKHYWISKDGKTKQIFEKDLQKYLDDGWVRGRHILRNIQPNEICYMTKNSLIVQAPIDWKNTYLKYGWNECTERDYKNRSNRQYLQFRYWVHNDVQGLKVCEEQKEIFLEKGYKLGRGKRRYKC